MKRLLVPTSALLWGLQFAFLNPSLALILVALYDATPAQVGWVLAVYNASGFVASLLVPSWADRRGDYLRPMLACGTLTLTLVGVLWVATGLPLALTGLVVLGGPAGVGSSLLFAHLRHSGAPPSAVVNTRAMVSVAWVAGPAVATAIIGLYGNQAILLAIAAVAVLNVGTTLAMIRRSRRPRVDILTPHRHDDQVTVSRVGIGVIMAAFVLLQATNNVTVAVMSLYVTQTLGLPVLWAGVTLGVAAALEIPALLGIGRLTGRVSSLVLIATGCGAGLLYYLGMTIADGPVALLGLQLLNAWFFAAVAGVGLTYFQQVIPRPGLASGLFTNTRRIGAIVSGAVIALGSQTVYGYRGTFALCAGLTLLALALTAVAGRAAKPAAPTDSVQAGATSPLNGRPRTTAD